MLQQCIEVFEMSSCLYSWLKKHRNKKSIAQKSCLPALVALHFQQTTYSSKAATKNQIKTSWKNNCCKNTSVCLLINTHKKLFLVFMHWILKVQLPNTVRIETARIETLTLDGHSTEHNRDCIH